MEWERLSTDSIEEQLAEDERLISRLRARQMACLAELDTRQIATADGSRSLSEWVSARLDQGIETARTLARTMRRLQDRPDLQEQLAGGNVSFDRVEALSRIPDDVGLMEWADVAAVRREATKRAGISAESEFRSADDRFLVMQPSLDESWWRLWGGLDGHSGSLVDKVLSEAADDLPGLPDGTKGSTGWRRATALVETLISDDPPPAQVTVFVDAKQAAETGGETGMVLESGSRVGRQALQAILCDAETEVTAVTEDGRYLDYGRKQRTAPPALRRALLHRYNHTCGADGCQSQRRLQIHHLTPWSQGGETNQDVLVVLCWFHHQVVVHERGFQIYFHHDPRRIRFRRPKKPPRPT
jgi:5-methylcytosine-specific restriction endonuclease McrA